MAKSIWVDGKQNLAVARVNGNCRELRFCLGAASHGGKEYGKGPEQDGQHS